MGLEGNKLREKTVSGRKGGIKLEDESEDRKIEAANEKIFKLERRVKAGRESEMSVDERLNKLPGMLFIKREELRKESTEISTIKSKINHILIPEVNRLRDHTIPGKKPGVTKPKFTVERAEFEAKKYLRKTHQGYRTLKDQQGAMHDKFNELTNQKKFLVDMFEAAKVLKE